MFRRAIVVFLKEMKDLLRDKKTFIFGLVIPLLLMPVTLSAINYSFSSSQKSSNNEIYIAISDIDNSFYNFCTTYSNIRIVDVENDDYKAALESEKIVAYLKVDNDIDEKILNKEDFNIEVYYSTSSLGAMMSIQLVEYYKELYTIMVGSLVEGEYVKTIDELRQAVSSEIVKEHFSENYPYKQDEDFINLNSLYFNMLVPMMLVLYCCVGSSSTASDISAGEKERGTLEALLSTSANRTSIILGKLIATTTMGLISGLCTVLGLSVYLLISSGISSFNLSSLSILALFAITLFTAMFFAAVNLTIGVYSRSSKEAQTYLMPVSIISLLPTYFMYSLDIHAIKMVHLCVPIVNIICIIKEILANSINILHFLVVAGWLLLYILLAFFVTSHMFKKESIIFRI